MSGARALRGLRSRSPRLGLTLFGLLLASGPQPVVAGPGQSERQEVELVGVPEVSLEHKEERVRERLGARRSTLEALARGGEAGREELAEAYGEMGKLYLAHGLSAAAEACLHNAERLEPADARWPYYLGTLYQEQRSLEASAARYERVLAIRERDVASLLRLAEIRLLQHRLAEARALFAAAVDAEPSLAAGHHGLARIASTSGDFAAAAGHFETTLALQPQATRVHYSLALTYRELGETEQALRHLEQRGPVGVQFPDPLSDELTSLVESTGVHLYRAGRAMSDRDFEQALEEYRQVLALEPDHAVARRSLGIALFRLGRLPDAIEAFRQGLEVEPDSALLHYNLGTALAAQGSGAATVEHLRRAVELAPELRDAHFNLAMELGRAGRFEEALAELDAVLELAPNDLAARLHRSQAMAAAGDDQAAVDELRRILELAPRHVGARLRIGQLLFRLGESEQAEKEWDALLELDLPDAEKSRALVQLGNLFEEQGGLNRALESYRAAVQLAPGSQQLRLTLAAALLRSGRYDEALAEYDRILAASPRHRGAELGRATTLVRAGRHGEGRIALERALGAHPDNLGLGNALARLLATCPLAEVRDGQRALELARSVFEGLPSLEHGETVAMAYAELGRFEEAIEWQRRLLEQAEPAGPSAATAGLRSRLALYERGEPYRSR